MVCSTIYENPSKGKESKNTEKLSKNPWKDEINHMEKLLFFERIAAEWSAPSDRQIKLNKDRNSIKFQKCDDINSVKSTQQPPKDTKPTSYESKLNNVEPSSLSITSQKSNEKVICNVCNKPFKRNGLKQHMTKIHKTVTDGEISKFFREE